MTYHLTERVRVAMNGDAMTIQVTTTDGGTVEIHTTYRSIVGVKPKTKPG